MADQLRTLLLEPSGAALPPERVATLAADLIAFVLKTEMLLAGIWSKLAPRSQIRLSRSLGDCFQQCLTGESTASPEKLTQELQTLQQLMTALVTGISRAGEEFAKRCSDRFTPEAIGALAKMEEGGLLDSLVSDEVKCWRKYKELAEALTEESVQRDIELAIGNYAEAFVRGMERIGHTQDSVDRKGP